MKYETPLCAYCSPPVSFRKRAISPRKSLRRPSLKGETKLVFLDVARHNESRADTRGVAALRQTRHIGAPDVRRDKVELCETFIKTLIRRADGGT